MTTYQTNEALFEIPEEWKDQTVNIFSVGSQPPLALSVVISRDILKDGQAFSDYADTQIGQYEEKLKDFRLISKRQVAIGDILALEAEFTWNSGKGPMHQRQTFIPHDKRSLTVTVTAPVKISDIHHAQVDRLIQSFRFRDNWV